MGLKEEFESSGNWLFRWRSYIPLFLLLLVGVGLMRFRYPFQSHLLNQIWTVICLMVSFVGLGIRILVIAYVPKNTSGRNTKEQVADTLNTRGLYSIVRNPLYLGNFLMWLGIFLSIGVWWLTIMVAFVFWIYYERIIFAEEEYLRKKFGETFLDWSKRTPCFIPNVRNWNPSERKMSLRKVLRQEYSGFFAIIACFTSLEIVKAIIVEKRLYLNLLWIIVFTSGLIVYVLLRALKKKTKILDVN